MALIGSLVPTSKAEAQLFKRNRAVSSCSTGACAPAYSQTYYDPVYVEAHDVFTLTEYVALPLGQADLAQERANRLAAFEAEMREAYKASAAKVSKEVLAPPPAENVPGLPPDPVDEDVAAPAINPVSLSGSYGHKLDALSIMREKCAKCHSGALAKGGMMLFSPNGRDMSPAFLSNAQLLDLALKDVLNGAMPPATAKPLTGPEYHELLSWLRQKREIWGNGPKTPRPSSTGLDAMRKLNKEGFFKSYKEDEKVFTSKYAIYPRRALVVQASKR